MAGLGYGEKNSRRAYVSRTAPDSCQKRAVPTLTFSANCIHKRAMCASPAFRAQAGAFHLQRKRRPEAA
jgi:hypothetical protein